MLSKSWRLGKMKHLTENLQPQFNSCRTNVGNYLKCKKMTTHTRLKTKLGHTTQDMNTYINMYLAT